ncbi:thioesterase domain-containing protein, partial [Bradyrhizobium sp. AUGA SZCCT0182]|uniref:thioesterase domain-containing protein n=1 Tax=Bradyrhizobium sp. AUGA SZCCT0182 TaxID=2807667 RepID=UPI00201196FB
TQTGTPATPFFQFGAGGDRPPLFFFNGNFVSGHAGMRRMVELFGPDCHILSIDPHGLRGESIPPSIEKMAADRLPLILERQSSGPFLLGGKCNGAMVAFETARLLMAAGQKVDMVAMVDPPTISARPVTRTIIALMKPIVSSYCLRWTYEQMARLERFFKAPTSKPITIARLYSTFSIPNNEIPPVLWDAYSFAMSQYLPAPLEVPVTFYAADHDGRAWRHVCAQLDVIEVPGGHSDCLTIGAELLVDHLRPRIDGLVGGAPSEAANP